MKQLALIFMITTTKLWSIECSQIRPFWTDQFMNNPFKVMTTPFSLTTQGEILPSDPNSFFILSTLVPSGTTTQLGEMSSDASTSTTYALTEQGRDVIFLYNFLDELALYDGKRLREIRKEVNRRRQTVGQPSLSMIELVDKSVNFDIEGKICATLEGVNYYPSRNNLIEILLED